MRAACACGGTCPHCVGGAAATLQPKLAVSEPDDAFEQEADRMADAVMRTPDTELFRNRPNVGPETTVEVQRQEGAAPGAPASPAGLGSLGSSVPLPRSDRDFFEPRFGRSFAQVRIHTGDEASKAAQSIDARAFTFGNSIVMGEDASAPGTYAGRALLAHELTHVVQQGPGGDRIVRRQTINPDCSGREGVLNEAWAEGLRLTEQTIDSLNAASAAMQYGAVPPYLAQPITNAFGDIGLTAGFTFLPDLIKRYQKISDAFHSERTFRCDISKVAVDQSFCDQHHAFVIRGNSTDIFICPSFFEKPMNTTSRGVTLLHEMAHSALGISHQGGVVPLFNCSAALGLEYDDAKRNAHAYGILTDCLHGSGTQAEEVIGTTPAAAGSPAGNHLAPRWSISAAAGADVTPGAQRFAAALGGQVSLRTGEFVVFNPVIGLNLLYLPSSSANPSTLAAATADIGLRIQQPLQGFYFDVSAGGYAGFDVDPGRDPSAQFTGGPTAAAGAGWRWQRLELGVQARALVPDADFDRTNIVVFGRAALMFP